MHDICMLLDARMILEWAFQMRVGAHLGPILEILVGNLS